MSLQFAQNIGLVRNNYDNVKLHHWVILYAAGRLLTSTRWYQSLTKRILSHFSALTESFIPLIQMGLIPDSLIRWGIRLQLRDHLHILQGTSCQENLTTKMKIIQQLRQQPIAIETTAANEQHYEVPAAFYDLCLGPCKKYSSGYWPTPQTTFEESELHMLELYCQRAELQDGMKIVDLGCGWGSLTLFLAAKYPNAKITSISNSHSQRDYIMSTAAARGLNVQNIQVITVSKRIDVFQCM
jgi:cyclopropane-fatty-acyl-phospholipid synthase